MTLSALIRKRNTGNLATAIPAISATQPKGGTATVARIATVAVANPKEEKTASPAKVSPGDTATASRSWLVHYSDREPLEVACCPEATHAEILERHPDAVAAEPSNTPVRPPASSITGDEKHAVLRWLGRIGETDPATIAEVLTACRRDAEARDYFTGRAALGLPKPDPFPDDRRSCAQCANLIARRCQAAQRGAIVASRNYEPIRDLPRRCEGYAPGADDPDRRPGRERWPALIQKGGD